VTKFVTRTGRSLPIGRTTRKNKEVKRPSAKPLPLHLQCHPQKRHRLPTHPGCRKHIPTLALGGMLTLLCGPALYAGGHGLSTEKDRVQIDVADHGTWYCGDSAFAFAWKQAAEQHGFRVAVYVNG
jgi:hypothetical protein